MEDLKNKHLETFHLFRKLNFTSIMPNISNGEFVTLMLINKNQGDNPEEGVRTCYLAEKLQVAAPAVSRTIRTLESKELVRRMIDEKDRRNIHVRLTDKGTEVLNETEEIMNDFFSKVAERIGHENMEKINSHLRNLYEVSKEELENRKYSDRKEDAEYGKNI